MTLRRNMHVLRFERNLADTDLKPFFRSINKRLPLASAQHAEADCARNLYVSFTPFIVRTCAATT